MTPVRTLLGAKDFSTSLICLKSLLDYSADPVRLIIHEDGTLNDGHREQLRVICPTAEFIDRKAADEIVCEKLAKYPSCLKFRLSEFMSLKLFDICLFAPGPVWYCDSDILFFRNYHGLFTGIPNQPKFMKDVGHAYAVRPWQIWPLGKLKLSGMLNAGITIIPDGFLDLEFLNWLLDYLVQNPVFHRRRYWTEQTCWAALAARTETKLLDPRQIVMATRNMENFSSETIAVHFVATYRNRLAILKNQQQERLWVSRLVQSQSGRSITPMELMWTDIRRRLLTRR